MNEIRKLHTSLWVSRNPMRWLIWPIRAYINFLLESLSRFFIIILLWILFFGFVYWAICGQSGLDFAHSIFLSAETFLAFQPPDIALFSTEACIKSIQPLLFVIPAILGFIHLGVLISHLYLILIRRPGG